MRAHDSLPHPERGAGTRQSPRDPRADGSPPTTASRLFLRWAGHRTAAPDHLAGAVAVSIDPLRRAA